MVFHTNSPKTSQYVPLLWVYMMQVTFALVTLAVRAEQLYLWPRGTLMETAKLFLHCPRMLELMR